MEKLNIPDKIIYVLNCLKRGGFEAYLVGGCVRDLLIGNAPKDWDITTSAIPQQIKECFLDRAKFLEIGKKFGTIGVLIDNEVIEVTTYRVEDNYVDSRRPDKVIFTDNIVKDLSRRDFTINAIAYNPEDGFVDPFNGKEDIKNRLINSVGNADERFSEDALRILRALRFSAELEFKIDDKVKGAVFRKKELILEISKERIFNEFCKLMSGDNVGQVLREFSDVIGEFIPEIKPMIGFNQMTPYHKYDVYEHTVKGVENIEKEVVLRLSMFFHDIAKPRCFFKDDKGVGHFYGHAKEGAVISERILSRLKVSREIKDKVCKLVKLHDVEIKAEERVVCRWMNKLGIDMFNDLIKIKIADNKSKGIEVSERLEKFKRIQRIAKDIVNREKCFSLKKLKVNGNDIINMGISPSKRIGEILKILLNAVIDGECENEKSSLLNYIKYRGIL